MEFTSANLHGLNVLFSGSILKKYFKIKTFLSRKMILFMNNIIGLFFYVSGPSHTGQPTRTQWSSRSHSLILCLFFKIICFCMSVFLRKLSSGRPTLSYYTYISLLSYSEVHINAPKSYIRSTVGAWRKLLSTQWTRLMP